MIEPVICPFTTEVSPVLRTKSARINSAVLPKVTFSKPPIAEPARCASCSVARRIHSASGTIATTAQMKVQSGPTCRR